MGCPNRWGRKRGIEEWLKREAFVIADRCNPSGPAYGLANGPDLNWMLRLEEGLSAADIVIVIDISVEASYNREEEKEIYEKDKIRYLKVGHNSMVFKVWRSLLRTFPVPLNGDVSTGWALLCSIQRRQASLLELYACGFLG